MSDNIQYVHVDSNLNNREVMRKYPEQCGHPFVHKLVTELEKKEQEISSLKLEIEE